MGIFTRILDAILPTREGAKARRRKRQRRPDVPGNVGGTTSGPDDDPLLRGHHGPSNSDWKVHAWTGSGGDTRWRSIDRGDVPTKGKVRKADQVVIAVYPPGATEPIYRTFRGPIGDVNSTIEYWVDLYGKDLRT